MKTSPFIAVLMLAPVTLTAQDEPPPPQEQPPAELARVELARSRACVPALARLAELDRDLQPLLERAARLAALDQAVRLEDSTDVAPFAGDDPLESAVRQWFVEDGALGRRWAESRDSAIAAQRDEGRAAVRGRIVGAMDTIQARGQERVAESEGVQEDAVPCDGAILVRSAVREVCDTAGGPVCEALADTSTGPLRFVDAPEDVWDVQQLRAWTEPGSVGVLPQGNLGGARTAARARRGNVMVAVAVTAMIRDRSNLTPEQVAEFDAHIDSLGFDFEHPRLVFAPAIEVQLNVAEPLGGETHYTLHFGDLSDPPNQVIWTAPVGPGGPIQAVFPAAPAALARLRQGEALRLTALAVEEGSDGAQGEAIYTIPLATINQSRAVGALLAYMSGGELARDLARLVPPDTTAGGG